jgi:Zn-finger nucleic acid-binding protein
MEAAAAEAERKTHYMKCPKDGHDLRSSEYQGVQIETCPNCGGMWLDAGELEIVAKEDRPALMTRVLSEALSAFRGSDKKRGSGQ